MRFRRRRFTPRRRRATWDMQTYRICEQDLGIDFTQLSTCNDPEIHVDYICGVGDPSNGTSLVEGASRAVMFGGGFLQVRYNAASLKSDDLPCHPSVQVVTALVVLPLLSANELTPAYLPNLMVTRQQASIVTATKSDTDENILWWWGEQLDLANLQCSDADSNSCWPNNDVLCHDGDAHVQVLGTAAALYGRLGIRERIKVKRRLDERHALFLTTQMAHNFVLDPGASWPLRRNVYLRYAVRRSK